MTIIVPGLSATPMPDGMACAGLDLLGLGFGVLGRGRKVVLSNQTWASILSDAGRGLIWNSGALGARRSGDLKALNESLETALTGERSLLRIEDVSGGGALELLAEGMNLQSGAAPLAAVIIRQPETVWPDADSLASLYGLTPAEAGLAESLVRGVGLAAACRERAISLNTGKGYLKRIFEKTGTRRQSELVALVMKGVSPFAACIEPPQIRRTA